MNNSSKLERYTKVVHNTDPLCNRTNMTVTTEVSITDLRGLMRERSNMTLKNIKPITEIQFLSAIN